MEFFTAGEKLKKLRKQLGIRQHELEEANVSRSFISMVESGRKGLSKDTARALTSIFRKKAAEKGMDISISDDYLIISPEGEAQQYCMQGLENQDMLNDINSIDEIIDISNKYKLIGTLEKAYMLKANYLFDRREFHQAFACYNEILEIKLSTAQEDDLAFVYNKLAKCKICLAEYYEALTYLNKGYNHIFLHEDKAVEKYILYNLALCHRRLEDYDESLEYASKLISMCDVESEFQDYMGAIILSYNCYIDKGYVEEGVQLYNEAIKKFSDETDPLLGYIYNNLGTVYLDYNNFGKALEYLEKARDIRENFDKANLHHTLINIAHVYEAQNLLEKAKELIYKTVELAKINKDKKYAYNAYEMLERLYTEEKDYYNLEKVYKAMLEILEDNKEDLRQLKLKMKLSLLYMNMNRNEEAKEFLEASLRAFSIN